MKRLRKLRDDLAYRARVSMEDSMDALDWCNDHRSKGKFHFIWSFTTTEDANADILGDFHFTKKEDHTLFLLRWHR